ncbi:MAG TPA: rhomboid family intramembrane serine protease [Gemmatimonadales bacterium]|nr:rhomboid family intramembrane serine protease [Gemmatimonadales bacterium]
MSSYALPRPTPWVWRLIIANAVVLLLLTALLPALARSLMFVPSVPYALRHPWTVATYMFVHAGLLHLAFNMLILYSLGTRVEERMGGRSFILFYLYCGLGGALFSLGLAALQPGAVAGASAAVLGVAVAYAMFWPDAELMVFPLPWPIRARTLVIALLVVDLVLGLLNPGDGVAHIAHLGGAAFGFLFFRLQRLAGPARSHPQRLAERAVMVQSGSREAEQADTPVPRPRRRPEPPADAVTIETDRLLDKISGQGIASLTPAERRFLDEVSKRKRH